MYNAGLSCSEAARITMSISPPAPNGNKRGPTVYRIDFAIVPIVCGAKLSSAKHPNLTTSPMLQHVTVSKCCQQPQGMIGDSKTSTPARTDENRSTCIGLERVKPIRHVKSSRKDAPTAAKTAGRSVSSQTVLSSSERVLKPVETMMRRTLSHMNIMVELVATRAALFIVVVAIFLGSLHVVARREIPF